jgi:hypothetical protein
MDIVMEGGVERIYIIMGRVKGLRIRRVDMGIRVGWGWIGHCHLGVDLGGMDTVLEVLTLLRRLVVDINSVTFCAGCSLMSLEREYNLVCLGGFLHCVAFGHGFGA